jgi:hypothetical protein
MSVAADLSTAVVMPGLLALVVLFTGQASGGAEPAPAALPEGNAGLAARYPGDIGIEKDPAVLFHDDFEGYAQASDFSRKWEEVIHLENMRLVEGAANPGVGRKMVEFTIPQRDTELAIMLQKVLKDEQDVVFLRFYSKYDPEFDIPVRASGHSGGSISAHYSLGGRATPGQRATGTNKFLANFECESGYRGGAPLPGPLNIYIYHPEQRGDFGDHFFPTGVVMPNTSLPGNFGPHFVPRPDFVPELGRWYCYEYMVKANTPGQRDGRIACWVDGKLVADFPNLRLRDVDTIRIERSGVSLHLGTNTIRANRKWYDDVVAATSYIGPLVVRPAR